jgi:hypothetical protein
MIARSCAIRDPVIVLRVAALLLVASGCDVAFPLEAPPITACGIYAEPVAVEFDPSLQNLSQFSVDGSGTHGLVHAMNAATNREGLTPIVKMGEVWIFDLKLEMGLELLETQTNAGVKVANLTAKGELFGGQQSAASSDLEVYHYKPDVPGTGWLAVENEAVSSRAGQSTTPGGEIEVLDPNIMKLFRSIPVVHQDVPTLRRTIEIAFSHPVDNPFSWVDQTQAGASVTAEINAVHEPTQGALARSPREGGPLALVYAATPIGKTGSDLFVSEKHNGTYPIGIRLAELSTSADEVEPFVNEDCSAIYFRRGDTIMMAVRE